MQKTPLILLALLILLSSFVIAQQQYLTFGVTRDSTYQQSGTGVWAGRTAATSTRAKNWTSVPLVQDLDNDGTSEIIMIRDTSLYILNYTTGTGLVTEATYNFQTTSYSVGNFYQTPGLFDYDGDGSTEIIIYNRTHMITLNYSTTLNVEQTTTTGVGDGAGVIAAVYPTIKCAPGTQFASGNDTCLLPVRNRTATPNLAFIAYDLDANTLSLAHYAALPNADTARHNTHLADADGDGFLEMWYVYRDLPNDDQEIIEVEVSATGVATAAIMYDHALAGSVSFTDIIVNNLEPDAGLEITWGFTADNTNWNAFTIDADGTIVQNSYCTVLTCPEGESASFNLVESTDTTYCDYSGDVYYYVRNAANNDPGVNTDTIFCLSLLAGAGTQETTVSNVENFTSTDFFIHQASLYGSTGILTPLFGVQGSTKHSFPAIIEEQLLIPVDYSRTGTLDIIGMTSQSRLVYYDDAYNNQNIDITSLAYDTANPVCQNELLGLTIDVTDAESNPGYCHVQETLANGTQVSLQSNTSVSPPASYTLNYFADSVGTFPLNIRCRDQYHTAYFSRTYTVSVSNDTTSCNIKGDGGAVVDYTPTNATNANANFLNSLDGALSDVGASGSIIKGIIWVLVILVVVVGIGLQGGKVGINGEPLIFGMVFTGFVLLLIGWYANFIGTVPIVFLSLLLALMLGWSIARFVGFGNSNGGG